MFQVVGLTSSPTDALAAILGKFSRPSWGQPISGRGDLLCIRPRKGDSGSLVRVCVPFRLDRGGPYFKGDSVYSVPIAGIYAISTPFTSFSPFHSVC